MARFCWRRCSSQPVCWLVVRKADVSLQQSECCVFVLSRIVTVCTRLLHSYTAVVCWQIEAIRRGLTQVVPQAAFELFTWQEVEKRICGDAEITMTALRQNSEREIISLAVSARLL